MPQSKKSAVVSAIGVVMAIVTDFMAVIRELGGTDEDFYRLSKPEGKAVLREMAQAVVTAFKEKAKEAAQAVKEVVEELGWIELDPAVSFEERLARGNYKFTNRIITESASHLTRKVRRFIVLYDPKGSVSNEEMKRRIIANGDKPASLDDALEVGYKFPDRQRKNPIFFLDEDSVCAGVNGIQCAPVLDTWKYMRRLMLAVDCSESYRFAAVREEEALLKSYPPVGEVFELTLDGDAPENQPLKMGLDIDFTDKWRHNGPTVKGKQTRRFKLAQAGYQPNFHGVKFALPESGSVEGQWIKAFKAAYPQPDGKGPIGIADSSWVDNGYAFFPFVRSDGVLGFFWDCFDLRDVSWRWLVPADE